MPPLILGVDRNARCELSRLGRQTGYAEQDLAWGRIDGGSQRAPRFSLQGLSNPLRNAVLPRIPASMLEIEITFGAMV